MDGRYKIENQRPVQQIHNKQMTYRWFCCLFLMVIASSQYLIDPEYNYDLFMTQFGRKYEGEEKSRRQGIFNQNYAEMLEKVRLGEDLSPNQFLDWSDDELQSYLNYQPNANYLPPSSPLLLSTGALFSSPPRFDWRDLDRVTSIKRQGKCGGCWAFSTIAQYESLLAIQTNGTKYNLSEQYAIECETITSGGCNGGNPIEALRLFSKYGVPLQQIYPFKQNSPKFFTDSKAPICKATGSRVKLKSSGHKIEHYENLSVEQIQQMLINHGPITVGVYSKNPSFLYTGKSGLINFCIPGTVDHAVLLIGYNTTHWFIKNSWGPNWGHNGFGYIQKSNDCGLKKYLDVLHFDVNNGNGNSRTDGEDKTNMVIQMKSLNGKGWEGNILGVKQNNTIIRKFGEDFQNGLTFGPITVAINRKLQVQIVSVQEGTSTESIGFTIQVENKKVYTRNPGSAFDPKTILTTFCPSTACIPKQTIDYYLTLIDSWADQWSGTVLGFRPGGSISNFTMNTNGRKLGPIKVTFPRFAKISIYVAAMGPDTDQIGFQLRSFDGRIVTARHPGTPFNANQLLAEFCVDCLSFNYWQSENVEVVYEKSKEILTEKQVQQGELDQAKTTIKKLKVALFFLGVIISVLAIVIVIFFVKIVRTRQTMSKAITSVGIDESKDFRKPNVQNNEISHTNYTKKQVSSSDDSSTYNEIHKKPSS